MFQASVRSSTETAFFCLFLIKTNEISMQKTMNKTQKTAIVEMFLCGTFKSGQLFFSLWTKQKKNVIRKNCNNKTMRCRLD